MAIAPHPCSELTVEEYRAAAMLLGSEWVYSHTTHNFFRYVGGTKQNEWLDADTMEPSTLTDRTIRRTQYKEMLETP